MQRKGDYMAKLPAGTRKRENGTFEKRFTVNGKRYSIYATNTKELAEKEQVLREEIKNGNYTRNASITLDRYFDEWLSQKRHNTKTNSVRLYASHYNNHIKQCLGSKKIRDIEKREILEMRNKLTDILKPASVNHVMLILGMILHDAVRDEIITKNPASGIKPLKQEQRAINTIHRALTIEEQTAFMGALKDNYYYSFIALMIATGMRCGETSALTWQDIDYKNNVIHVTKTRTLCEDGKITTGIAKSKKSIRDIQMNSTIKQILQEHKSKMSCIPFATNDVFSTPFGKVVSNCVINDTIKNTISKVNEAGKIHMDYFTSHALRDTFATRYIEQGGNMQTLKKILGHSSITITMDLYAHVLPDTMKKEMDRIKIII